MCLIGVEWEMFFLHPFPSFPSYASRQLLVLGQLLPWPSQHMLGVPTTFLFSPGGQKGQIRRVTNQEREREGEKQKKDR